MFSNFIELLVTGLGLAVIGVGAIIASPIILLFNICGSIVGWVRGLFK